MTTADANATESPENVLGLLGEQAALYARLETLAVSQRSLVAGGDVGSLLALLADRQKLSQRLARVAAALAPIRQTWSTFRQSMAPPQQDRAEQLLKECRDRLFRIMKSDDEDARVLSSRKEAVGGGLEKAHPNGQAIRAYRSNGDFAGRIDCVDEGQ